MTDLCSGVMQRKYDIAVLGHRGLHKLFADSYLLTRSLPWHSTHLSPPSPAGEQQLFSAVASTLSLLYLLLSPSTRSWMCFTNAHIFRPSCRDKPGPWTLNIPLFMNSPKASFPSQLSAPAFCSFTTLQPRRLPLRSGSGKWNVVIEEKVQIGSGCKWSLVSGRRFLFSR